MEMVLAFLGAIALSALALEIASVALNGVGAIRRGRLAIDIQMGEEEDEAPRLNAFQAIVAGLCPDKFDPRRAKNKESITDNLRRAAQTSTVSTFGGLSL